MSTRLDAESGLRNPSERWQNPHGGSVRPGGRTGLVMGRFVTWSHTYQIRDGIFTATTPPAVETSSSGRKRWFLDPSPSCGSMWQRWRQIQQGRCKKGKKGGKGQRVAWVTDINQRHQLCMRFQTGNCRFKHLCAYPTRDGQACGKDHGALQHESTAHWLMDASVSQGSGSHSGSVTFSEGPGPSNSQVSFEFPPTPPPSQLVTDEIHASTPQVDLSDGNKAPDALQILSDHALPSPSVSLSSP